MIIPNVHDSAQHLMDRSTHRYLCRLYFEDLIKSVRQTGIHSSASRDCLDDFQRCRVELLAHDQDDSWAVILINELWPRYEEAIRQYRNLPWWTRCRRTLADWRRRQWWAGWSIFSGLRIHG